MLFYLKYEKILTDIESKSTRHILSVWLLISIYMALFIISALKSVTSVKVRVKRIFGAIFDIAFIIGSNKYFMKIVISEAKPRLVGTEV